MLTFLTSALRSCGEAATAVGNVPDCRMAFHEAGKLGQQLSKRLLNLPAFPLQLQNLARLQLLSHQRWPRTEAGHYIVFDPSWHMCKATKVGRTHEVNDPHHSTLSELDPGTELLRDALEPIAWLPAGAAVSSDARAFRNCPIPCR
ncbi:unnamed protein product [Symbiodinium sp. CCMP2592]|nr:unnamed protein product [Symbiodinium sp. CCMP2592]